MLVKHFELCMKSAVQINVYYYYFYRYHAGGIINFINVYYVFNICQNLCFISRKSYSNDSALSKTTNTLNHRLDMKLSGPP